MTNPGVLIMDIQALAAIVFIVASCSLCTFSVVLLDKRDQQRRASR